MHHPQLPHSSPPNTSPGRDRRVVILRFMASGEAPAPVRPCTRNPNPSWEVLLRPVLRTRKRVRVRPDTNSEQNVGERLNAGLGAIESAARRRGLLRQECRHVTPSPCVTCDCDGTRRVGDADKHAEEGNANL